MFLLEHCTVSKVMTSVQSAVFRDRFATHLLPC